MFHGLSLPLRLQELSNFLTLETKTDMVVDRSAHGELLRINFNISFPSLSCEFATLDVSDALGTVSHIGACMPSATSLFCSKGEVLQDTSHDSESVAETSQPDQNSQKATNQ